MTGDRFAFHNLTLLSADQEPRVLVRELSVVVPARQVCFRRRIQRCSADDLFHAGGRAA